MDVGFDGNYDDDDSLDESQIVDQLTQQLRVNLFGPSTSLPVSSTEDQLMRCRLERFEDEEIRKLEEDRLQEIIRFCESYNESQEGKRVRSLRVNEVDHLLELMKKPDVLQSAATTTIESNRLVPSMETSNKSQATGLTHSSVGDMTTVTNNHTTNPLVNSDEIKYNGETDGNDYDQVENDSGYNTNGVAGVASHDNHGNDNEPNGNKLTALSIEKSLINNEIDDMKQQQFSDAEDEELKEFQRIEKEIKLNELYKCLETIEKEIDTIKQYQSQQQQQEQHSSPSTLIISPQDQQVAVQGDHVDDNAIDGGESSSGSASGNKEAPLASFESDESASSSDEDVSLGDKVKSTDFSRLAHYHSQQHLDKFHTYSTIYSPTSETNSEFIGSSSSQAYDSRDNGQRDHLYRQNPRLRRGSRTNESDNESIRERQQRPLTIYLPATTNDLDLIDHIVNLGHDVETFSHLVQLTPTSCSGYLWKLCSNTENQWRKRYFLFNRQNKVFVYFKSFKGFVKGKKAKYGVYFNQIEDAYVDHNRTKLEKKSKLPTGSLRRRNNSTRHVFVIVTSERNFILSSSIPEVMRIWIDVIFTGAEGYLSFDI